ncbi:MAG: metallophosphoesterase family protein [Planctomycetota bacterium]
MNPRNTSRVLPACRPCSQLITALIAIHYLTSGGSLAAHDGHGKPAVAKVKRAEMYAPTAMPDRVVLTLSGDPRTTQAVTWRTSTEVKTGIAEIAIAEAGPQFPTKAKTLVARSEDLTTDLNRARCHSVTFQDLEPGTTYAYRVGDGTNWSEWFQFRSAAKSDEPFSFVYFGDAQNDVRSMWSRVIREAFRDAPKAAFFLHAGDLVNRAESDAEWGEWFGAGHWLNAMIPVLAVPGNHEQARNMLGIPRLSKHWRAIFTFAENGPPGLEETCYTLTYHNLRIIALDSNRMQQQQAEWMDQVLAANTHEWVICTFHHPIFSTGRARDNPMLRKMWKPILDKHRVDLVLQGHDHTYGRTGFDVPDNPPTASTVETNVPGGIQRANTDRGTIYVVSVSGPKMYSNTRYPFMKRVAEDTQLYQVIHINGDRLRFEARTAIGELYDSFELTKRAGEKNQLTEIDPEVPQNLRPLEAK